MTSRHGSPRRHDDTLEMLRRTGRHKARRRRLLLAVAAVSGLVFVAAVATGLAFAFSGGKQPSGRTAVSTTAGGGDGSMSDQGISGTSTSHTSSSTTEHATSSSTTRPAAQPTTTTIKQADSTTTSSLVRYSGKIVVIDPGHQARADLSTEPIGPGSSRMKEKTSSGTQGMATGVPESELDLAVSLKLRDALQAHGIKVVMTRTSENVNLSNVDRAKIANEAHADLFVRIHADGNEDPSMHGIHVLYPASIPGWTDAIAGVSKRAATVAQRELITATGAADRGIDVRDDMTGFNWSKVPVILPEIGFMSNAEEDRQLADAGYQAKIVNGLTSAILSFLSG
jgi:N-acetylmuramoyl-L-alanine amidase